MKLNRENEEIRIILDYLWHDEEKDYEASDEKGQHIFAVLQRVAKRIGYKGEE